MDLIQVQMHLFHTLKMDGKDFVELDGKINVDNDWVKEFMHSLKTNSKWRI